MGTKLTEKAIERLARAPGQRDRLVFDSEQQGLAVRVVATGSKRYLAQYVRYLAQYVVAGRKRRVSLGSVDGHQPGRSAHVCRDRHGPGCQEHRPGGGPQGRDGRRQG